VGTTFHGHQATPPNCGCRAAIGNRGGLSVTHSAGKRGAGQQWDSFLSVRESGECTQDNNNQRPCAQARDSHHAPNFLFRSGLGVLAAGLLLLTAAQLHAETLGSITLSNGSIIYGDIVDMVDGTLRLKAPFGSGDPFAIQWAEVTQLATSQPVTFVLRDGTSIKGTAEEGEPGVLQVRVEPLTLPIQIQMAVITAINPPRKKTVTFLAKAHFGGKLSSGNTDDKQINFLGGFGARSERFRFNLDIRWFYGEEDGNVTDRNAFANMKLDAFVTKRWYGYISTLFEQDTFDDLDLRSSVTVGPGYQFIVPGDFTSPYFNKMDLAGDVGVGFFSENRKIGTDDTHATGRWGINFNWPVAGGVRIFHTHQGFPSLEDPDDFYINTIQGIAVDVWKGLTISLQAIYKYDNSPPPSTGKGDFKGLLTIGYEREL